MSDAADLQAIIKRCALLTGQPVPAERLQAIEALAGGADATERFIAAWQAVGLEGTPSSLDRPSAADLPFVAWRPNHGWLLVQRPRADGGWEAVGAGGEPLRLADLAGGVCVRLPARAAATQSDRPSAFKQLARALLSRRQVFVDALLATALVNVLTLATSLYAMQVFDRVVPNQGYSTLIVLTVGVVLAILFEAILKQVRAHVMDRTATEIDQTLSGTFFERMQGIRMEARPAYVGTLAAQVKGFELVRGVMASSTLFILADIPFALLFIAVIALVGGKIALVPLLVLPVVLGVGLMFQNRIQRHTRETQRHANLKAGLLVETADGAEYLKAMSGEWRMQGRWQTLAREAAEDEGSIRAYTAMAQNLTTTLQQLGYVAIIAVGGWLVTENELTLGGLIACSIIANRALLPIVQLPSFLVQWAHARAALEGLEKIMALPNELDEKPHAIATQALQPALAFERVSFAYRQAQRAAIEIERLEIRPGERVGLIGPVGSGKSTLLKLASGLYRPDEGRVYLSGIDMSLLKPESVRELVGYLPQEVRLFSGTLRDNLILGLADPGDEAILDAARQTGLIDLVNSHPKGLGLEIAEGGRGLSGGQKQLAGLTRLLLANPKVWLLDEPTGAMDAESEARVVALFRTTWGPDHTIIVSTHKTALLPVLTRLVVLRGGRIVMDGPRDEILARLGGRRLKSVAGQTQP